MTPNSPVTEATELSAQILADMELGKIQNHQILLKCRRLARLVGDDNWRKWLDLEIHGYNTSVPGVTYDETLKLLHTSVGNWTAKNTRDSFIPWLLWSKSLRLQNWNWRRVASQHRYMLAALGL